MGSSNELRPAIERDVLMGVDYVEIVDDAGAAGYDPTNDQIVEAALTEAGQDQDRSAVFGRRVAELALNTRNMHEMFVALGENDIRMHVVRGKEMQAVSKVVDFGGGCGWRDVLRTTEIAPSEASA